MSKFMGSYRIDGCLMPTTPVNAPMLQVDAPPGGIPRRVDLRAMCSPVENQGDVGSCAANAIVGALEYHQLTAKQPLTDLSRLFVYYNSRKLADKENEDAGTFIHHVMAAVMAFGACPENVWPYIEAMWRMRPNEAAYHAAQRFTGVEYAQVPVNTTATINAVANGLPVVFGMLLSEALWGPAGQTGVIRVPEGNWPRGDGGHAMLIVGYDLDGQYWIVRNSWGESWGGPERGHVRVPFAVMDHYAMPSQFWTIGAISAKPQFSLLGASQGEAIRQTQANAPREMADALAQFKSGVAADLEDRLAAAKKNFRDRLRGPGAGGGY